jgi:hypothetical protein
MIEPSEEIPRTIQKKRLDQYKSFFMPTLAEDQDEFYALLRPSLGYELSTAYIDKEDMPSYILQVRTAQEMLDNGQIGLVLYIQTTMTSELKLTDSIDGRVVDNIFSNKMEYTQTQTLHEYQHQIPRKKGFFGRLAGNKPSEEE